MKVSLNWLKELVNIETIDAKDLANKLTQAGFEVEDIETIKIDDYIDFILDITSTANRSDALSMIGLSREVAALTEATILDSTYSRLIDLKHHKNITISDTSLLDCNSYLSAIIHNTNIVSSPTWLKNRLQSSGFTSQNLIVDISNYIMLKWGQPINIIDFNKIVNIDSENGLEITSRFCSSQQKFIQLENRNIDLSKDILITQINKNIISIAGIGINSKLNVNQNTKSIFIEAAIFKQGIVRRSSKIIGIRNESSIRQERGLNIDNGRNAYIEALSLLIELTGGNISKTFSKKDISSSILNIDISLKKVHNILGPINDNGIIRLLSFEEVRKTLESLQFNITNKDNNSFIVSIPNYRRHDIFREIDIIEEIARVYGYNKFQSSIPKIQFKKKLAHKKQFINKIRSILRNLGLSELVHYSLVKSEESINLNNPLIKDYSALRSSLLDSLIQASAYNIKQSNQTLDGFEIGTVFNIKNNKIRETTKLGIILGGNFDIRSEWSKPAHSLNWYEAKGIVENFFYKLNRTIGWKKRQSSDSNISFIQNKKSATLTYNNENIGLFGEVNQLISSQFGLNTQLFVLEIDLDFLEHSQKELSYLSYRIKPYSKYPSITRDLSIIIPQDMEINYLFKLLDQFNDEELESTKLFDYYTNQSLGKSKKSIGLRFTYRSNNKTLTNLEIDTKQRQLQENITRNLNLEIRK
uniref:phenylalanyl-tRNA synthetase beta subunit n=1 Tax=Bangia atropurpurea TaxID=31347 RepID=UPI001FCDB64F|nr:phenylalanyl-tRNA synthetase beta subunit [Bangia atropurpurea]UNJ18367.1 phenylalanyl-tRNA synthetase beta subunit [Bangia atropurpurea]